MPLFDDSDVARSVKSGRRSESARAAQPALVTVRISGCRPDGPVASPVTGREPGDRPNPEVGDVGKGVPLDP